MRTGSSHSFRTGTMQGARCSGGVSFEHEAEEPEATGIPHALAYLKRMLAG